MSSSAITPDPNEICPASGLTNRSCMASICDCFPDERDRWVPHPERFQVMPLSEEGVKQLRRRLESWTPDQIGRPVDAEQAGRRPMSQLVRITFDEADDLAPEAPLHRYTFPFLDEFIATDVDIHFEAMSNNQFWIGIEFSDGTHWAINCGAINPAAKGYANAEEA